METKVSRNCTLNIHRSSTPGKEANQKENTAGKIAKRRQIRKFTHAQIQIFRARFIASPSVEFPKICWTVNIFVPFQVFVDKIARHLALQSLFFSAYKQSAGQILHTENLTDCTEANWRLSKTKPIITGKHFLSWSLSLTTKIILIIFTTANDSLNLAHRPFDASNLEKREHKNFPEKQYAGTRANFQQKPYEPS